MEEAAKVQRWAVASVAVAFDLAAFACSVTAELKKAKINDMKLDGRLCFLPRTPAFRLGITVITCLSIARIAGTYALLAGGFLTRKSRIVAILSWVCFGTGTSMNNWQRYGEGWLDGDCYLVRTGVYLGVAALVIVNLVLNRSLTPECSWCCRGKEGRHHEQKAKCIVKSTSC